MAERCSCCGVTIEDGSVNCGFCGAPLNVGGAQPPQQGQTVPPQQGQPGFPQTQTVPPQTYGQFPPQNQTIPPLYRTPFMLNIPLTPVFGCWCIWRNSKALGENKMEWTALIIGVIFLVVFLLIPCFLMFGILYLIPLIVYYFAVHRPYNKILRARDIIGYPKKSLWTPGLIFFSAELVLGMVLWAIIRLVAMNNGGSF